MAGINPQEAILAVCKKFPEGVPNDKLELELEKDIPAEVRAQAINSLLAAGRLNLFSSSEGLVYKEVNQEDALRLRGLTTDEMLAYQAIEQAGNTGIWTKDMRYKTSLTQPQLKKILKNLEDRHLVKTFKPVENKTRKMYILYTLQPAEHLTGGAWYTNAEKDTEFIDMLRMVCSRIINRDKNVTLTQVAEMIRTMGYSRVPLKDTDVRAVIDTLIFDGTVDEVEEENGSISYQPALLVKPDHSPFTSMPCGVCPVFNECKPGGTVSPETCIYFDKWLEF